VAAFEESLDVMRGLWRTTSFSYSGAHFRTAEAELRPPADRAVPIWLGAYGPRMLDLTGRKADGWLPTMFLLEPEAAFGALRRVREAALNAGRDPDRLTYGYNVGVAVGEAASPGRAVIAGDPEQVARALAELVRGGFTFLNLSPAGDGVEQRERLARDVLPLVRTMTEW
jgi:alkanesulfonate monooxygenase SsuD/methylene tetrahydromethanopterin reductase-like flavin-dependent oxidoreductase (luciferase family)